MTDLKRLDKWVNNTVNELGLDIWLNILIKWLKDWIIKLIKE